MPTPLLKNIIYTQLDSMTWCATAHIDQILSSSIISPDLSKTLAPFTLLPCPVKIDTANLYLPVNNLKNSLSARQIAQTRRQQQRKGVRLLLQSLLINVGITDLLEESQFPYRLIKSSYYVCFSHSGSSDVENGQFINKIAVIISTHQPVGIDIEIQAIAWHVAQRFYHPTEIEILAKLPIDQRHLITKWLWQLKESFIKIYQYTLAQGLGKSYAAIIPELIARLHNDDSAVITIKDKQSDYQISALPYQHTLIVF